MSESTKTEKKDTFGGWLFAVALWLAVILFAVNQGAQIAASQKESAYTFQAADDVLCAVAVNGSRQSMRCFAEQVAK